MLNLPPLPSPPAGGEEILLQLVDYYRQLVEYHEYATNAARSVVEHLQALPNMSVLTVSSQKAELIQAQADRVPLPALNQTVETIENSLQDKLQEIFASSRGKVLHLDFIVRKLYGLLSPEQLPDATASTLELLKLGTQENYWYAVPDSPNCWTLELSEFPEFKTQKVREEPIGLLTVEASKLLGIPVDTLLYLRSRYADNFIEGVHYYKDKTRRYYWTDLGLEELRQARIFSPERNLNPPTQVKKIQQISMIAPYQGLSVATAVEKLLRANPNKLLKVDAVISSLYGNVSQEIRHVLRQRLNKTLSEGKLSGRWDSIPGRGYRIFTK
jgi:hypothetical protein